MSKILYIIIAIIATIAVGSAVDTVTGTGHFTNAVVGEVTVQSSATQYSATFSVETSITYEQYNAFDNSSKQSVVEEVVTEVQAVSSYPYAYDATVTVRASNGKALAVFVTDDVASVTSRDISEHIKYANEKGRV